MQGFSKPKARAQAKVKRANKKKTDCADELEEAREDPKRRDELPELREALEEAKTNVNSAKEEEAEIIVEFDAAVKENFDGVFVMLKRVSVAVNNVYQSILLANGMHECEYSLKQLYVLFGTTISAYCAQAAIVYTSFLDDTGVVNQEASRQLILKAIADDGAHCPP